MGLKEYFRAWNRWLRGKKPKVDAADVLHSIDRSVGNWVERAWREIEERRAVKEKNKEREAYARKFRELKKRLENRKDSFLLACAATSICEDMEKLERKYCEPFYSLRSKQWKCLEFLPKVEKHLESLQKAKSPYELLNLLKDDTTKFIYKNLSLLEQILGKKNLREERDALSEIHEIAENFLFQILSDKDWREKYKEFKEELQKVRNYVPDRTWRRKVDKGYEKVTLYKIQRDPDKEREQVDAYSQQIRKLEELLSSPTMMEEAINVLKEKIKTEYKNLEKQKKEEAKKLVDTYYQELIRLMEQKEIEKILGQI
ncbi:MAG: hypothetical protein QW507_01870 [Candidatus Nanoarchaeia archaeon]|nr:hypothetical protein [Candidatus Haiyanarchaeum thermophilum]MCW1302839.1 hypothetical protein [Candidatus Haiyanarchaeum thermophilum]MCW1303519.1 hypothetical protein [Candidatus Haiyanarchaeum thermophilum]MCW1306699.1 hypothetical protein [Candidatus Haiyanarchaeum thermophilum]MCW1307345.1 hypothetical protein [Candidatus Haiyanarchaeum thermophilum]